MTDFPYNAFRYKDKAGVVASLYFALLNGFDSFVLWINVSLHGSAHCQLLPHLRLWLYMPM